MALARKEAANIVHKHELVNDTCRHNKIRLEHVRIRILTAIITIITLAQTIKREQNVHVITLLVVARVIRRVHEPAKQLALLLSLDPLSSRLTNQNSAKPKTTKKGNLGQIRTSTPLAGMPASTNGP